MVDRQVVLVAHNLRSCHNVGSLLRTADGLGVAHIYLTGYTPYPHAPNDNRLPHLASKLHRQIQKTALGAEKTVSWEHNADIFVVIDNLKKEKFLVAGLEQTADSISLPSWKPPQKIALLVGRETEGLEDEVVDSCDIVLEIPMLGQKESLNVVQAAAMALYHCRFS